MTPDGPALSAEVADVMADHGPVVALESTIISHGLPHPLNAETAVELEEIVRSRGACPATIGVVGGRACIGIDAGQLAGIAVGAVGGVRKIGLRDLPMACARGVTGGTTVSATAALAAAAGIRVFGTGGLGGVHRGWAVTADESADLTTLSRTRLTVVAAGVKSLLDIPATLQRLETLNITVIGYRTDTFPGFYVRSSGETLDWRVESSDEVVTAMSVSDALGLENGAILVANPVPEEAALDVEEHDRVVNEAVAAAGRAAVTGQALTPYLLAAVVEATGGRALEANLAAVRSNVALAAEIAVGWASRKGRESL